MKYSRFTLFLLVALTGLNSWADEALIVKSKGRSATGRLKLKSSKVPTYEIFKDKNIPRLDIGEEAVGSRPVFRKVDEAESVAW